MSEEVKTIEQGGKVKRIELTSQQTYLARIIVCWFKREFPKWKITVDNEQYFNANNGKRFIGFNFADFKKQIVFMNIREDGDTRTCFNGFVQSLDQVKDIFNNVW